MFNVQQGMVNVQWEWVSPAPLILGHSLLAIGYSFPSEADLPGACEGHATREATSERGPTWVHSPKWTFRGAGGTE